MLKSFVCFPDSIIWEYDFRLEVTGWAGPDFFFVLFFTCILFSVNFNKNPRHYSYIKFTFHSISQSKRQGSNTDRLPSFRFSRRNWTSNVIPFHLSILSRSGYHYNKYKFIDFYPSIEAYRRKKESKVHMS